MEINTLTASEQKRGMRLVYLGQGVGVILNQLLTASAFGVLLVKHIGGTDFQAMILVSLMLVTRFMQLPVSLMVPPRQGKRFLLGGWLGCGVAIALGLGATYLNCQPDTKVWVFLLCVTVGMMSLNCGSTFWFPLLHDLVPPGMRGRFFGKMRTSWSCTSFAAVVLSGLFLGDLPKLWRFQAVLAVGLVLFLSRIIIIKHVPEAQVPDDSDYADWKRYVRDILSRREVLVFCVYFTMLTFISGFLGAPLVLYMERMGFSAGGNMLVHGCSLLGQILTLLIAGILADRIGTKRTFVIAHIVLCAVSFCIVWIGSLPFAQAAKLMPIATMLCGAMLAMAGIACTVQLFHLAPDRGRAFFMSLASMLFVGGAGLSPLLAGAIDSHLGQGWQMVIMGMQMDLFQVIFSCAGAGMALLMIGLYFVEDVRPASASDKQ